MSGVRHIHNLTIHLNLNDKTLLLEGWRPSLVRAGRPHTAQLSGLPTGWRDACLTFPCFTMFYSCIYSCMMVLVAPCRLLPKSVHTSEPYQEPNAFLWNFLMSYLRNVLAASFACVGWSRLRRRANLRKNWGQAKVNGFRMFQASLGITVLMEML